MAIFPQKIQEKHDFPEVKPLIDEFYYWGCSCSHRTERLGPLHRPRTSSEAVSRH